MTSLLRVPALRIRQSPHREVISFAVDGKRLGTFATVARVRRDASGRLDGYQRPEVLKHIAQIQRYVETADAMLPGALVIAFDHRVRFLAAGLDDPLGTPGILEIPLDETWTDAELPGLLVDGQQRTAAIRDARVAVFPVFCSGFIARSDADQRSHFILVNNAKPLPRRLIHELLPITDAHLPAALLVRRFPARLLERLNQDRNSPLAGLIDTPTTLGGRFKDTSILKMLEASLLDGALYRWRDPQTGDGDIEAMLGLLKAYWTAVELTWPEAFALTPRHSRLVHGAGVAALGAVMDDLADRPDAELTVAAFSAGLAGIAPVCAWTQGTWHFAGGRVRAWNELQNTGPDIRLLSDHLTRALREQPAQPANPGPGARHITPADEHVTLLAVSRAVERARHHGSLAGALRTECYAELPAGTDWTPRAFAMRFGRLQRGALLRERHEGRFALTAAGRLRLDELSRRRA